MRNAFFEFKGTEAWGDKVVFDHSLVAAPADLARFIRQHDPTILHLSLHGGEGMLSFFEKDLDANDLVKFIASWIADGSRLQLMIANVCYSATLARALAQHVDFVIGHEIPVADQDAVKFAQVLYGYLGAGKNLLLSYEAAKLQSNPYCLVGRSNAKEFRLPLPAGLFSSSTAAADGNQPGCASETQTLSLQSVILHELKRHLAREDASPACDAPLSMKLTIQVTSSPSPVEIELAEKLDTATFCNTTSPDDSDHERSRADTDSELSIDAESSDDDSTLMVYNEKDVGECKTCAEFLEQFLRKQLSQPGSWTLVETYMERHGLMLGNHEHLSKIVDRLSQRGKLKGFFERENVDPSEIAKSSPLRAILLSLVPQAWPDPQDREEVIEEIQVGWLS